MKKYFCTKIFSYKKHCELTGLKRRSLVNICKSLVSSYLYFKVP